MPSIIVSMASLGMVSANTSASQHKTRPFDQFFPFLLHSTPAQRQLRYISWFSTQRSPAFGMLLLLLATQPFTSHGSGLNHYADAPQSIIAHQPKLPHESST